MEFLPQLCKTPHHAKSLLWSVSLSVLINLNLCVDLIWLINQPLILLPAHHSHSNRIREAAKPSFWRSGSCILFVQQHPCGLPGNLDNECANPAELKWCMDPTLSSMCLSYGAFSMSNLELQNNVCKVSHQGDFQSDNELCCGNVQWTSAELNTDTDQTFLSTSKLFPQQK